MASCVPVEKKQGDIIEMSTSFTLDRSVIEVVFPSGTEPPPSKVVYEFDADEERSLAEHLFRGRKWSEIEFSAIRNSFPGPISELPTLMTDSGFSYYLPLFMAWSLELPERTDSLNDAILFRVCRDSNGRCSIIELLNRSQISLLSCFLSQAYANSRTYKADLQIAQGYLSQ
jgi:hypothetical protein